MTNVTVVVGAQFGSEGKGAITSHLARSFSERDAVMRVAGPNAGHTAYDAQGKEWKLRCVPVAAVTSVHTQLMIGAGSEIDLDVLDQELWQLDAHGYQATNRLRIHPSATILNSADKSTEIEAGLIDRIGSTGKGIGAARASRIMRRSSTYGDFAAQATNPKYRDMLDAPGPVLLDSIDNLLIEGTQGYGLGLHTEFYPQVTSSDCRAIDFLAMAGISPWAWHVKLKVVLVARLNPIRVAGNSGPLKGETSWAGLGLPEERTTVTNNVRRVGEWDQDLVEEAIRANGGGDFHVNVGLALTMLDHRFPEEAGVTDRLGEASGKFVEQLEDELGCNIEWVGTGPRTVVEL